MKHPSRSNLTPCKENCCSSQVYSMLYLKYKEGLFMCTHITLSSKDGKYLAARTMDFSFELEPEMALYQRNYPLEFEHLGTSDKPHYAFMGLSKNVGTYICADGVNECGLSVAELYFEDYAHYSEKAVDNKTNVGATELLIWFLAYCKNTQEAIDAFDHLQVVTQKLEFIGGTPPLHWVLQDATGHSVIIEITVDGINIHENKLGVLTNSPNYQWHLTNVRTYIGLDPTHVEPREIYGMQFKPFGQGSGTFGLPGDLTPPSRFIRALYAKLSIVKPLDAQELVVAASHVLNSVDIPKGSVITQRNSMDYTQYTSYINCSDRTYTYRLYHDLSAKTIVMDELEINGKEIILL